MSARAARLLTIAIGLVGVGLDQVTKAAALTSLKPGESVVVLGPVLKLTLAKNPGAAFSLGTRSTWLFTLLAIVAFLALVGYFIPRVRVRGWAMVLGFFLAGITGNLIDRLVRPPGPLRGHVIDFLELPRWPIFNVADMCICAGAGLVVVLTFVSSTGYDGNPTKPKKDDSAAISGQSVDTTDVA